MELVSSYKWANHSGQIAQWLCNENNTPIMHKWFNVDNNFLTWSSMKADKTTNCKYSFGVVYYDGIPYWFFSNYNISTLNPATEAYNNRTALLYKNDGSHPLQWYKEYSSAMGDIIQFYSNYNNGTYFTLYINDRLAVAINHAGNSGDNIPLYGAHLLKDGEVNEFNLTTVLPAYISAVKTLDKGINTQCIATPIVVENLKTPLYRIIFNNTTFEIGDTIAVDGQRFFMIDENIGVIA